MRRPFKALVAGVAALALSGASVSLSSFAYADGGGPSITTDHPDYAPGAAVHLTGTGWADAEAVHLTVDDSDGQSWHYDADAVADGAGGFAVDFNLPSWFVANYTAVATGASGTASTSFTDGSVSVRAAATNGGSTSYVVTTITSAKDNQHDDCSAVGNANGNATTTTDGSYTSLTGVGANDHQSVQLYAPATVTVGNDVYAFTDFSGDSSSTGCVKGSSGKTFQVTADYVFDHQVAKADQHLTFDPPAKTYGDPDFSVASYASSDSSSGIPITFSYVSGPCTLTVATVHLTGAGSCVIRASQAGNSAYNAAQSVDGTIQVDKATPTCTVTGYSVTYDGTAHTATGSCTGVGGAALSGLDLSGTTHTAPGTYGSDVWAFTDSTGNYSTTNGTVSDAIGKAAPVCSVTGYSVTYDGTAHTATGSCTGVGGAVLPGLDLSGTTHTDAGTYGTDAWAFTDSTGNYSSTSGTVSDAIAKASATCSVDGYSVTYDGNAHTATGSCTGVGGELLSGLDLSGTSHTNAGSTLDSWSFTDVTGNYNDTSGNVTDVIGKADASCSVTGYSVTYDGNAHSAAGTCTGVKSEVLAGLSVSGTTHTNAGTYASDGWSFTDVTGNYNDTSGTVTDVIGKADASCSVTGYSVTYDGNPHSAAGTCTGVKSEVLAGLSVTGTTHTNAGSYPADPWSFTDATGNYKDASGTVADAIAKANASCSVTAYSVTYDGNAHTATGSCLGAKGELLAGLSLSGTTHTNAGSYPADSWSFTDATGNYNDTSGTVADAIAAANPTCTVTGYSVAFDGSAHTATGSCRGVKNELLSALDLSGTTHTNAGTYSNDPWAFHSASSNYNDASGTVTDVINTVLASLLYTGTEYVMQGTNAVLSASVSSSVPACVSGQTVSFTLTPQFSGGTGLSTTAVTGSTGQASKSVSTSTLQTGVYEVAVSLLSTNCVAADVLDSLTVVGAGDTANGGGWYTLDSTSSGSGRVNFGFTVQKVPNTSNGYKGQLLLQNNGKWRLKATLDCTGCYGKSATTPPVGSVTGSGKLYKWDATLNGGLGDWALVDSAASFTANFTDASAGGGKKSSDAFSISIAHTTQAGEAPLPNSKLIQLKGGDVKLT